MAKHTKRHKVGKKSHKGGKKHGMKIHGGFKAMEHKKGRKKR